MQKEINKLKVKVFDKDHELSDTKDKLLNTEMVVTELT